MISAGGFLREGRFARFGTLTEMQHALDAARPEDAPSAVKERLQTLWPSHREALLRSLEVRMRERTTNLGRWLEERAEKEASDISTILEELENHIWAELEEAEQPQLELFSTPEREQFERNKGALWERLESIPEEIEREIEAIRARYADPTPRLFPVAVTYLIPEKIARDETH